MIENSFDGHMKFQKWRDNSFTNFMQDCRMAPFFIATYSDNELKIGLKGLTNN